jgi:hypothetical protein
MTHSYPPAQHQGTEVVRRRVRGDFAEIQQRVQILEDRGLFLGITPLQYDEQGSFAIVTYRDPDMIPAVPRPAPRREVAVRQSTHVVQRPIPKTRMSWRANPLFGVSLITGIFLVLIAVGWYFGSRVSKEELATAAGIAGGVIVVVIVLIILATRGGGGGGSGHGDGWGFHWSRCR